VALHVFALLFTHPKFSLIEGLTHVQAKTEKALVKQSKSASQHQYSQGRMGPQNTLYMLIDHLKPKREEHFLCR